MRCQTAKSLISRSFDEPIREYDRSRLEEHVQACHDCGVHVQVLERGRELLQRASLRGPSENFEWKVQLGIQKALRERASGYEIAPARTFWRPMLLSSVAVASLVVLLGVALLPSQRRAADPNPASRLAGHVDPDLRGGQPIEIYDPLYVTERGGRFVSGGAASSADNSVLPWTNEAVNEQALLEELLYLRRLTLQQQDQILRLQAVRAPATLDAEPDSGTEISPR